jgi:hypothetical protein
VGLWHLALEQLGRCFRFPVQGISGPCIGGRVAKRAYGRIRTESVERRQILAASQIDRKGKNVRSRKRAIFEETLDVEFSIRAESVE